MFESIRRVTLPSLFFLSAFGHGCAKKEVFPDMGSKIVSPADIAASEDHEYFYVLNTDMDRTYNQGSIVILDNEGTRINVVPTARLGRSLTVGGKYLIATFDDPGPNPGEDPRVVLYDISDPKSPTIAGEWQLDCLPINAAMRSGYKYFSVACQGGALLIGDLEAKTLKKVRQFSYNRRAMFIDPVRGLLLSFVTDIGSVESFADLVATDESAWDARFDKDMIPNEVPDNFEDSREHLRIQRVNQHRYQFTVYDIAAEAKENFPYREESDPIAGAEYRWLYFNLTNFDGSPDQEAGYTRPNEKYYRTNFWEARPDLSDANAFYLSHRGLGVAGSSPDANNILRVEITGDLHAPADGKILKTESYLNFKRIYGFGGSQNTPEKVSYIGDFEVTRSHGLDTVIVNNFRDLVNFRSSGASRFTISAGTLDPTIWFSEKESTSGYDGYYQIARGKGDTIATCSFYGNAVILLEVRAGTAIREVKRIN
jgi:hypothetical protein